LYVEEARQWGGVVEGGRGHSIYEIASGEKSLIPKTKRKG
jgi:hypothetical protein